MTKTLFALAFSVCALTGCAASTSDGEPPVTGEGEDELKAAQCPASVDVLVLKPTIATDAQLKKAWAHDMADYEDDPAAAAAAQLTQLGSHVAKARAETAVRLHGTRGAACFYATVDANTGKANGYSLWFAKTTGKNGELQLRIERDLGTPDDVLFFNAPVKTLSPTSVAVDSSRDARVFAQHHETGYHGEPDGPNAWIGYAKITATLGP